MPGTYTNSAVMECSSADGYYRSVNSRHNLWWTTELHRGTKLEDPNPTVLELETGVGARCTLQQKHTV